MSIPLEKVLALRPTNVVTRLGSQSRLPILNPRDLLAASEGQNQALACIPAYGRTTAIGALKAARDLDSVIGIAVPYPLADRDAPGRIVQALAEAADEVLHRAPLFLQAGPFRLTRTDGRTREQLASAVFKYVDAGFTLVSLDASRLPVSDAVAAYRELAQPAIERELSIEVAAPVDESGALSAEALRELLQTLSEEAVRVNFVRVPAAAYTLEAPAREAWQLDLAVLKGAAAVAHEFRAALSIEDEGTRPEALADAWLEAGVRKVEPAQAAARAVLGSWTQQQFDELEQQARASGLPVRDLIARAAFERAEDQKADLRAEAGTWGLVSDLLPGIGAQGSASRAIAFLAQGGHY